MRDPDPVLDAAVGDEPAGQVLDNLLVEISDRLNAGQSVDVDDYARRHPDLAERLRQMIPAMRALAELGLTASGGDSASRPPGAEPAGGRLGDFHILREIGRGGMGVVYEAEQISLGRRLALKVLPFAATLDPRHLQRFRNEAHAAAALDHPNIVAIHSVGCERGVHYYAMQYVDGRTLAQVIAELRGLDVRDAGGNEPPAVSQLTQDLLAGRWTPPGRKTGSDAPTEDHAPGGAGCQPADSLSRGATPHASQGAVRRPAKSSPPCCEGEKGQLAGGEGDESGLSSLSQARDRPHMPDNASNEAQTQPERRTAAPTKGALRNAAVFRSAAQLAIQAAEALDYAHQMGVVHRDIKPSNLMVDSSGHLWITDFGLAMTAKDPALTMTGDIVGTLRYMSPEQALGDRRQIDHRTDIYSLGITLYELVTLQPAFDGRNRESAVRRLLEEDPPRPRIVNPAIPRDLETIVLKATAKEPRQRYASAQEMADDLKRFLAHEPICARRPTLADRAAKWARRHQPLMTAAIAFVALSAVGLAASTLLIAREQQKTAEAYQGEKQQRELAEEQQRIAQEQERLAKEQKRVAQQQERLAIQQQKVADQQKAEAQRQRVEAESQKTEAIRQRDAARQNLYYADMRLACMDIALGNAGRARDAVLRHLPAEGATDRRAWEWYYLLARTHEAKQALYGHGAAGVSDIAWNPRGDTIASVSSDGSARVWDPATGRLVRRFDHGAGFGKLCVGWSPDGSKLAWGSVENLLRIWDRQRDTVSALSGHQGPISALAWSHDGRYVATGADSVSGRLRIWSVADGKSIRELTSPNGAVGSIAWSPNDRLLAAFCYNVGLVIWDVASGKTVCEETGLRAFRVSWHPSQARLAIGNLDGDCLIWDQPGRKTLSRWLAHRGTVNKVAWSPDGRRLLSAGRDGMVKLWDAQGHEQLSVAAHAGAAGSVTWDSSGKRFASSGIDGLIRVWSAEVRPNPLVIDGKLRRYVDLAWDRDSNCLLVGPDDNGKILVWDAGSGVKLEEVSSPQDKNRRLVSFRYLAERSGAPDAKETTLKFTPVPPHSILDRVALPDVRTWGWRPDDAVLSPDGGRAVYMSPPGNTPTVYHFATRRTVKCPAIGSPGHLAWSSDGARFAVTAGGTGRVHAFDADSGTRLCEIGMGTETARAAAVAWSHDGRRVAAGNEYGLCQVWEVPRPHKLLSVRIHPLDTNALAWSLDDRRIASGGAGGQIHLWDSASGEQLLALEPENARVIQIRWSPDGRKLAALHEDGRIKVWDATAGYRLPQREFHLEQRHYRRAQTYLGEGERDKAMADLDEAIRVDPGFADAYYQLAYEYRRKGERDKALANHNKAIQASPKDPAGYTARAEFYLDGGECEKAEADFARAEDLGPLSGYFCRQRALTQFRLGHYDKAVAYIVKAVELDPHDLGNIKIIPAKEVAKCPDQRLRNVLLELADKMVQESGSASSYAARSMLCSALGQSAKALADATKAIELDPNNDRAWTARLECWRAAGQTPKALAEFDRAVELHPTCFAYLTRAAMHFDARNYEKAEADYARAAALGALTAYGYRQRALGQLRLGHYDQVLAHMTKAVELSPRDAAYNLSQIRSEAANCPDERFRKGLLELADKSVKTTSDVLLAYTVRARLYHAFGQLEKASLDYQQIVRLLEKQVADSRNPELSALLNSEYSMLGALLRDAGRLKDAENAFRRALAIAETLTREFPAREYFWYQYVDSHERLIKLLRCTGRAEEADQTLHRMSIPPISRLYIRRAEWFHEIGDDEKAEADFARAEALGPMSWHLYKRRGLGAFRLGRYDKALAHIARAVDMNPGDSSNLWWIPLKDVAKCPDEGFRKGMLQLADRAVEKSNGDAWVHAERGMFHFTFGDARTAEADFRKALQLKPEIVACYSRRGRCNGNSGYYDVAIADFDKAIRLDPTYVDAYANRGYFHGMKGDLDKALADFNKAIKVAPDQAHGWYLLALTRLGASQTAEYRKTCAQAISQFAKTNDPKHAHSAAWTCVLAPKAVEDWITAIALAEKAVKSDPNSVLYLEAFGAVLYRAGQFEQSLAPLTEAGRLSQKPDRPKPDKQPRTSPAYTSYFLAMAHHRLGHRDEAKKWLDKAAQATEKALADDKQGIGDPMPWNRRLTLQLFRAEAETLLKSPSPPPPESKGPNPKPKP